MKMIKEKFVLEGTEEVFEGFYFPNEFYGAWENPCFDQATMERLADFVNEKDNGVKLRFDPVSKVWFEIMHEIEWTRFNNFDHDGVTLHEVEGWCFVVGFWK